MYRVIIIALLLACSKEVLQTGIVTGKYKIKGKPHLGVKVGAKHYDRPVTVDEYNSAKVGESITLKVKK